MLHRNFHLIFHTVEEAKYVQQNAVRIPLILYVNLGLNKTINVTF